MKNYFSESLGIESKVMELYMNYAKTAVLESNATLTKQGANEDEICIPKIEMSGLADYDRNTGYTQSGISMTWQNVKFNYTLRWKFNVDTIYDEKTLELILKQLIDEVVRTKIIPQHDAFRFARYADLAGIKVSGTLSTGVEVLEALQVATIAMNNADIPSENRHLFITSDLLLEAQNIDANKSYSILVKFTSITEVPKNMFHTTIDLLDGKCSGKEKTGFKKASDRKDINFLIVEKSSVMQLTKYKEGKIISPEDNQDGDALVLYLHEYGFTDVCRYKPVGIYLHYED